jgi:hypothetical protein
MKRSSSQTHEIKADEIEEWMILPMLIVSYLHKLRGKDKELVIVARCQQGVQKLPMQILRQHLAMRLCMD